VIHYGDRTIAGIPHRPLGSEATTVQHHVYGPRLAIEDRELRYRQTPPRRCHNRAGEPGSLGASSHQAGCRDGIAQESEEDSGLGTIAAQAEARTERKNQKPPRACNHG
jgi:hypothetical protein